MERMLTTCGNCGGVGHTMIHEIISDCFAQSKEVVCKNCNGTGWAEYAVFSIEEAQAILKHCGLDAEN